MKPPFYIVVTEIGKMPTRMFSTLEAAERAARQFAADDPESTFYVLKTVSQCRQVGLEIERFDDSGAYTSATCL